MNRRPATRSIMLELRGRATIVTAPDRVFLSGGAWGIAHRAASELVVGDFIGIAHGGEWTHAPARLPELPFRARTGSEKRIKLPSRMSSELALLLGAYASEGHTTRSNWSVIFTNSVPDVLLRVQAAIRSEFDLQARLTAQRDRCPGLVVSSKRLVEFMELLECGNRAANKRIPDCIMSSTRDHVLAFLQGFALDAYATTGAAAKWAICLESKVAIDQLQQLLTKLGVVTGQVRKYNSVMNKSYFELYAAGPQGQKVCRLVPFLEPDKARRAEGYLNRSFSHGTADVVPGIRGPELYNLLPPGRSGRNGRGTGRQAFRHLLDPRTKYVARGTVEHLAALDIELPLWLRAILDDEIHFVPLIRMQAR